MKKGILIFLLLFLNLNITYTQITFNKIIDLPYFNKEFYDLIVHNDTIVCYGRGRITPELTTLGVVFVQLDELGDTLRTNIVTDTTEDFLGIDRYWGKVITTPDGGYAATTAPFYKNDAWLIKLNSSLEPEYIKVYEDTINRSNFAYVPFALDDGFILHGYTQGQDYYSDGFISLTNENGDRQWTSYDVNGPYYNGVSDVGNFNDSLLVYITTNGTTSSNAPFQIFRSALSLIDREGEVQHTWRSEGDPEIGYLLELEVEEDGIVLYGQYVVEHINDTPLYQSTISKISRDLDEIYWIRHFGPIRPAVSYNGIFKIEPTLDGNYIGAGSILFTPEGSDELVRYGWLYKFTSNGELMWELKVPPPTSLGEGSCSFYGVGVLPDSSIVAGGTIVNLDTGERHPWLVKVTNDGCLDTLCAEIQTSSPKVISATPLDIFPNPATDYLHIQHHQILKNIRLVDALGKEIWNGVVQSRQYRLDLAVHLANGIYFVLAEDENGRTFRQKVLVQR